jgi:hypothetical protein
MSSSIGSSIASFGASYIPDLADAANIQSALKSLYFGSTGAAENNNGIYGALRTLYIGNPSLAGTLTLGAQSTQFPLNLAITESTHATSRRASIGLGSQWQIGQDSAGDGTRDFYIYGNSSFRLTIASDGTITIPGNVIINGETTTINSTTITVDDKLLELGAVASPTDTTANGGGISLFGATNKTIIWDSSNANWTTSENWNLATGKALKINNVNIASGTGAALVLGANASTTIAIGANGGTATILNPTVTLTNATVLNINGASPSIVTTSTGTASVFNTNATTLNFGGAATTMSIGNTATAAQTVNMFTASTGASTYNIATGANGTGVTKTVNLGTGGASASSTNINLGAGLSSRTTNINLNGRVSLSSSTLTSPAVAGKFEYTGDALYFTPKLNNSTAGRGLVPSEQILILNSNLGPTTVTSGSGDGLITNSYSALNKTLYLAANQAYFVDMSIVVFHNLVAGTTGGTASISFSLIATSGAQGRITAISVIDSAALTGGTSTMEFFSGNANALSESLKSISAGTSDQGYSILKWSGVISNSIAGNFAPQITISATNGSGTTSTASATIQAGSYCKVTPLGASGSEINIGGWA